MRSWKSQTDPELIIPDSQHSIFRVRARANQIFRGKRCCKTTVFSPKADFGFGNWRSQWRIRPKLALHFFLRILIQLIFQCGSRSSFNNFENNTVPYEKWSVVETEKTKKGAQFLDFSLLDPDSGDQCGSMRIPYPQPWFLVIPNILDILVGKTNGHICAPVCWCL